MSLVFVDTNVLAYARDVRDARKQHIAMSWLAERARQRSGRLSSQVLIEFYAVATHPRKLGLDNALAQADVRALEVWAPIAPDAALLARAWSLQVRYDFSSTTSLSCKPCPETRTLLPRNSGREPQGVRKKAKKSAVREDCAKSTPKEEGGGDTVWIAAAVSIRLNSLW